MYTTRTYFTIEDIKNDLNLLPTFTGPMAMQAATGANKKTMIDFLNACLTAVGKSNIVDTVVQNSTYAYKMWTDYLYPKFYNRHISYINTDYEDTGYEITATFVPSIGFIYSWLKSSNDKYSLLIKNLEDNKLNLLDRVSSIDKVRFNDIPQQEDASYDNDDYNTTITTTERSSDVSTLMFRLKEIENNIANLYEEWANEFRKYIYWSVI